jgi:four helix bundle protein
MKKSDNEFNRYLMISIGSTSEIVAILDICLDQKYIKSTTRNEYVLKCEAVAKKLYGFNRKLKS